MTHSPPDARRRRCSSEYRWTNRKTHAFLDALACHGKVAAAARAGGMTRQSAWRLGARVPVVAEGWARAQAIGREWRRGNAALLPVQGDTSGKQAMVSATIGTIRDRKVTLLRPKVRPRARLRHCRLRSPVPSAKARGQ